MTVARPQRRNGFTLVEVLVAVLVLAIGLVGVASLQVHGLRNFKESGDDQVASVQVHSLAERIRMVLSVSDAAIADTSAAAYVSASDGNCPASDNDNQALRDYCDVWAEFSAELPADELSLDITTCGPDDVCTIRAVWKPKAAYGAGVSATTTSYELSFFP